MFTNIKTERLILRKFRENDTEYFFKYRTIPEVFRYQSDIWADYSLDQAREFITEQMDMEPGIPDTWFQIAIELKAAGKLIGDLGVHTLPDDPKQVEIGFTLDPAYQNMGYGAEAVKCLIGYIFNELHMHRIIAIADVRNRSSVKLLEKIGLRREGHFIKNAWNKGEYTDEYWYALLKEEWPANT